MQDLLALDMMAKAQITVTMKDLAKVRELYEAASHVLPAVAWGPGKNRLARALAAFSDVSARDAPNVTGCGNSQHHVTETSDDQRPEA